MSNQANAYNQAAQMLSAQQQPNMLGVANQANAYNQNLQNIGQAFGTSFAPPVMWEENVPEDELAYEGKCARWPFPALQYAFAQKHKRIPHHDINCCQRCVML